MPAAAEDAITPQSTEILISSNSEAVKSGIGLDGIARTDASKADAEAAFFGHRVSVAAVSCVELFAQRVSFYGLIIDRYLTGCGRVGLAIG